MSYSISYNRTTHEGTESTDSLTFEKMVTTDFAVTKSNADSCVLTNMTSPLGRPEMVEYQFQNIADVYTNTGIDRALWTPSKRGVAFFVKVTETWSAVDNNDPEKPEYALPVQATLRVKIPSNTLITTENVADLIERLAASLRDGEGAWRLAKLLRGSLNPKEG